MLRLLLILSIILSSITFPQNVSGNVQDLLFNVPVENVAVILKSNMDGTLIGTDSTDASGNYSIDYFMVGVDDNNSLPLGYYLSNPYPQPFNPSAKFDFNNPRSGAFAISIFNIIGQRIYQKDFDLEKGRHSFIVSGLGSAGIYLFNISGNDFSQTRKLILLDGSSSGSVSVQLTAGRNSDLKKTTMADFLIEFRKSGYRAKDTVVVWEMNLMVDAKMQPTPITKQASVYGQVRDSVTQTGIPSAQVSVYKSSNDELLSTTLTDNTGIYSTTFNFLGYNGDPEGIYNNIGDLRIEVSENKYKTKDIIKSFAASNEVDFDLSPNQYFLNATINLYNTKGDVITDLDSLKFIWSDSTEEMIPIINGVVTLNKILYLHSSDTTAEVTHNHPELYLNWVIGTTNNPDKVEWLYQNQTPWSTNNSKIPLNKINNQTTEEYLIPKFVNYGANNDLQIDMSGSVVTAMLSRPTFEIVSGFRYNDADTIYIYVTTFNHDTGLPIDQINLDRRDNEIKKFTDAVNSWTHKKLLLYEVKSIDSFQDTHLQWVVNGPRNGENYTFSGFYYGGPGNGVNISLPSLKIKNSSSEYNINNTIGQIQDEFFDSMLNTNNDAPANYLAFDLPNAPYTDLAKNLIGISLIMEPGTYYWEQ